MNISFNFAPNENDNYTVTNIILTTPAQFMVTQLA